MFYKITVKKKFMYNNHIHTLVVVSHKRVYNQQMIDIYVFFLNKNSKLFITKVYNVQKCVINMCMFKEHNVVFYDLYNVLTKNYNHFSLFNSLKN